MPNDYAVFAKDPNGNTLAVMDRYTLIDLTLIMNGVGRLIVAAPYGAYNPLIFQPEGILEVWRSVNGAPPYLVGNKQWLMRTFDKSVPASGIKTFTTIALDCNIQLGRRIIAHTAGSAQAQLTADADDMCKTVVKNEMGSGTTDYFGAASARDVSATLAVDANQSLAPSLTKGISARDVLTTLQEIAAASSTLGTYLAFDVTSTVPTSGVSLLFQTFTGQRGVDHRFPSGSNPVILTGESGSLSEIVQTDDYERVLNFIYAGGQGTGANRLFQSATDAASAGLGPLGRVEGFVSALNASTAATILADANAALRANRSKRTFIASYLDTAGIQFGVHFNYGDYVTSWFDTSTDVRLDGLNLHVENGEEHINLAFRTDS